MAQQQCTSNTSTNNVIDFFTGRPLNQLNNKILRIAPELDQMEILYSNDSSYHLYSLKIVCWALREQGDVVAMVPWLNRIVACTELKDPLNGRWEGYRDPTLIDGQVFFTPPPHKILELETAAHYYQTDDAEDEDILQEIPDVIGTHAVLTHNGFHSFTLAQVLSWRLLANGSLHGMLIDERKITSTPVLPGDRCLFPSQSHPDFKYFFQHAIANKIKSQDPEALAAIALLVEPG